MIQANKYKVYKVIKKLEGIISKVQDSPKGSNYVLSPDEKIMQKLVQPKTYFITLENGDYTKINSSTLDISNEFVQGDKLNCVVDIYKKTRKTIHDRSISLRSILPYETIINDLYKKI